MKLIKCLAEKIEDELHDADEYIELAMVWKKDEPGTADLFYDLSMEEMSHVDKIHDNAEETIREYREKNGEPPKDMMTLYNYLHEKHMEKAMKIRIKQKMYQEI